MTLTAVLLVGYLLAQVNHRHPISYLLPVPQSDTPLTLTTPANQAEQDDMSSLQWDRREERCLPKLALYWGRFCLSNAEL